jgi:Zn-dependent protease with chaperone function
LLPDSTVAARTSATPQNALRDHPAAVIAPPAAIIGLALWAILWAVGVSPVTAVVPAAVVGLAVAALLWLNAPQSALAALGARPLARGEYPRLENLVEGLCTTHGFNRPSLHVVETPAINAASAGRRQLAAHLILTRGALTELDRLELEAVVARQLCEIRRGVAIETARASVARIPGVGVLAVRLVGGVSGHDRVTDVDMEAVRLTSYPPALASALSKAGTAAGLKASGAARHLWLAVPQGSGPAVRTQPSMAERIDLLGEI